MLRRVCALILVLVCAFAPALPAARETAETKAADCCCHAKCACPPADCVPAPVAPASTARLAIAALERRASSAQPAARVARAVDAPFRFRSERDLASIGRFTAAAARIAPAAGVGLFQAHCCLLI